MGYVYALRNKSGHWDIILNDEVIARNCGRAEAIRHLEPARWDCKVPAHWRNT